MTDALTYHLDDFDGPLDLLLHLIKVNEVAIIDIPIVTITEQYLSFLKQAQERNLDIAGEFLVMAATLMSIKAATLLPKHDTLSYDQDLAEFVYEEDPREELMTQLLEYQRYQQAADELREREEGRQQQFSRAPMQVPADIEAAPLPEGLGLVDLQDAFDRMMQKRTQKHPQPRVLQAETWSTKRQMRQLMKHMQTHEVVDFESLFVGVHHRDEIVTTFLGMLELVRHQHLLVVQETALGAIQLKLGALPYDEQEELDNEK